MLSDIVEQLVGTKLITLRNQELIINRDGSNREKWKTWIWKKTAMGLQKALLRENSNKSREDIVLLRSLFLSLNTFCCVVSVSERKRIWEPLSLNLK